MRRLRPLSEAECYARLYGDGDPSVTLVEPPPVQARMPLLPAGEAPRRLFEERLDARAADVIAPKAA